MVKTNPLVLLLQVDLVNTKESLLSVCDKKIYKIKENLPHWEELENVELCILIKISSTYADLVLFYELHVYKMLTSYALG